MQLNYDYVFFDSENKLKVCISDKTGESTVNEHGFSPEILLMRIDSELDIRILPT